MSQPTPNQDWPAWITAAITVIGFISVPLAFLGRRIFGSVSRKQFKEYLEKRDELSDTRHASNTALLTDIARSLGNARERLSAIEGEMKGRYP